MTTVHAKDISVFQKEAFWRELLPTLSLLPTHDAQGQLTTRLQGVFERLNPEIRSTVLETQLFLLEDVNREAPNECLISINPQTNDITIRIFGHYLTDLQSASEWFIQKLLSIQELVLITPHTRCFIMIDIHGQRTDLLSGHVVPNRHHLWQGFYREQRYLINITAFVLLLTLSVVFIITPDGEQTPLGKFYGICGRILSAAIMNVFLLLSLFYSYRRGRRVVEWEKP